ncbi:MAG: ATP-binding protein [Desulfurococcaceae archaeon]
MGPEGSVKCARCGRPARVRVQYAKLNLCDEHFIEYLRGRVLRLLARLARPRDIRRVLVAVSGGKDSVSLLDILVGIRELAGLKEVYGLHIDLGIGSYSEESLAVAKEACERLGVPCVALSLRDLLGLGVPELAKASRRPACSVCGMVKRYIINAVGLELGVDAVVLGHHMDDILVFALKDLFTGDLRDLSKLAPLSPGVDGLLVTRIRPLYEVYEQDLALYSALRGLRVVGGSCPFKHEDFLKAALRDLLRKLEEEAPGFEISLSRRIARDLLPRLSQGAQEGSAVPCKYCGMPSSNGVCSFCRLTEKVFGRPMGPIVREGIKAAVLRLRASSATNGPHPGAPASGAR